MYNIEFVYSFILSILYINVLVITSQIPTKEMSDFSGTLPISSVSKAVLEHQKTPVETGAVSRTMEKHPGSEA